MIATFFLLLMFSSTEAESSFSIISDCTQFHFLGNCIENLDLLMKNRRNNCIDIIITESNDECQTSILQTNSAGIIHLHPLNDSTFFYDEKFQFSRGLQMYEDKFGPKHVILHRALSLLTKGK